MSYTEKLVLESNLVAFVFNQIFPGTSLELMRPRYWFQEHVLNTYLISAWLILRCLLQVLVLDLNLGPASLQEALQLIHWGSFKVGRPQEGKIQEL
jgi:hypothetical protein